MNDSNPNIQPNSPFLIVDGSSFLFRAYHALPSLETSDGKPTGAMKGVVNMLIRVRKTYEPTHMVAVFDAKGPTFRHALYPEYKANRPPMAEELASQIQPLHQMVQALGIPLVCIAGVEADDVIGTLAQQADQAGMQSMICTNDKDMAQLVNANIQLVNTMKDPYEHLDEVGVLNKFGVKPDQIIDYLTLVGDTVDNIPGVNKVGPKTAAKWLSQYTTLENLIEHADKISGKVGQYLREAIPNFGLTQQLVTIDSQVELTVKPTDLMARSPKSDELIPLYETYEFKTAQEQLNRAPSDPPGASKESTRPMPNNQYQTITHLDQLNQWLDRLTHGALVSFDTETTSLDYMDAELVGISLAVTPDEAVYIPCGHQTELVPEQLDRMQLLDCLHTQFKQKAIRIVGQNLKYDLNVLKKYSTDQFQIAHDTLLESYVLNSVGSRHDLDTLAQQYLNHETIRFEDIAGKGVKQKTFDQIPLDQATQYAAEDADITLKLHQTLNKQLAHIPELNRVYEDIDRPLIRILSNMETQGALINAELLHTQSEELNTELKRLEAQAHELAGETFNLASPKQLGVILFEKLGLPILKKTPKGIASTAESVLQDLAASYELPQIILQHRSFAKLKSTYTDRLPELIKPSTGRVHTSYHQAVTATGRLSSSNPNLQNIPVRTTEGRKIRQAFIAQPGCYILSADYSQIELRIMAHLSEDSGLCGAFEQALDIHQATAAEVFRCELDEVTPEQRRRAKAVNFGLIYGMSAFGLSKQLQISRYEAHDYIERYFTHYPGVKTYMERIRDSAHEQGFVQTYFGRRLYLPDIGSKKKPLQAAAERTAINAPMQGTAADLIKLAMISLDSWLHQQKLNTKLIMQVHDELVLEVPKDELDQVQQHLPNIMTQVATLKVPLQVHLGYGENWDQAH